MNLPTLISQIQSLDGALKQEATKAVNRLLTIRNWLIGYYIVKYEQKGEDKAKYGDNLLNIIADRINIKGLSETALKINRSFYIAYPIVSQNILNELKNKVIGIRQTVYDELEVIDMQMPSTPKSVIVSQYDDMLLDEKIINNNK